MTENPQETLNEMIEKSNAERALTKATTSPGAMVIAKAERISREKLNKYLDNLGCPVPENLRETFIDMAEAQNLNPFKKEIYGIPYENKQTGKVTLSIVTGYEVYLERAEATGLLDGWKVWTEGTGREMVAKILIYRKDRQHPFEWTVDFAEYDQGNTMWRGKPKTMIKKVVIGQGFRLCFREHFKGMPYLVEEIGTDDVITVDNREGKKTVEVPANDDAPATEETMEKLDELLTDPRVPKDIAEKYGEALKDSHPTEKQAQIAIARLHAQIRKAETQPDQLDGLRKRMHVLGVEVFGDGWDKTRPEWVKGINKDKTSSNELDAGELREMIARLEIIQQEETENSAAGQE